MLVEAAIILVLALLNGVFAAAEIAVISVRGTRLDALVAADSHRARAVQRLRGDPEQFLATVQIGVTVVGVVASAFGGATLAARLRAVLATMPAVAEHAESIALTAVVVVVSYLTLVVGELVPKSLALRHAERYALLVGRPLHGLAWLLRPVVWFLTASSNLVLRFFGDRTTFTEARLSSEEVQRLVESAAQTGSVHPNAGAMASRAFDFAGLTVAQVMVPHHRVVALSHKASLDEVRRVLAKAGHTRMPVYEGSLDRVVGYVNVKDLVVLSPAHSPATLNTILRPAYFVVGAMRAVDLLEEMKRRKIQFAVVIDELGSTSGIVTLEDLVEEIIGEVSSEHETARPPAIRSAADGSFVVHGEATIREVNRELHLDLPEGEGWSTIAGLCLEIAGRIPSNGERVRTSDGVVLEIVDASERKVRLVRLRAGPRRRASGGG